MPDRHPDHGLLWELEPVAERLLNRHLAMAKEWLPQRNRQELWIGSRMITRRLPGPVLVA